MLELGHQDLVAFAEMGAPPALCDEIDRLGRAAGEHHLAVLAGVDERADLFACLFETSGRALREQMHGSMDVGAVPGIHLGHRVDHRLGLERVAALSR